MSLHYQNKFIQFTLNNMSQFDENIIEAKEKMVKFSLLEMELLQINCTSKPIEFT